MGRRSGRGVSRDPLHWTRLTTGAPGHWFTAFTEAAGYPDVTWHRLRHSVATALVSRGDILGAQQRLGHADAHTTLRIYSHAQPLTDTRAAALLDHLYDINPTHTGGNRVLGAPTDPEPDTPTAALTAIGSIDRGRRAAALPSAVRAEACKASAAILRRDDRAMQQRRDRPTMP